MSPHPSPFLPKTRIPLPVNETNGQTDTQALQQQLTALQAQLQALQAQLQEGRQREDRLITELEEKERVRAELEDDLRQAYTRKAGDEDGPVPMLRALSETPLLPPDLFETLPALLQAGLGLFTDERERDVFLTGALAILSGCLPGVWSRYDAGLFAPNLYAFVVAPPGSGKGALAWARKLGRAVHERLKARSQEDLDAWEYRQEEYQEAKRKKGARPLPEAPGERPDRQRLFIPGDVSSAAMIRSMAACSGRGIMFETEADTLSQTLEKDWGTYSDILRKAHPHEPVTSLRRDDDREVERPCLSVVLSGTPSQVPRLIPSIENGLWSRFLFYGFVPDRPALWRDVRPRPFETAPEVLFDELSEQVLALYEVLESREEPLRLRLSAGQWNQLNASCGAFKQRLFLRYGFDASGTAHRAGLHVFRLATVLALWQARENGAKLKTARALEASDVDFEAALSLGMIYAHHAESLMSTLPRSAGSSGLSPRETAFYEALPAAFVTAEAVAIAESMEIPERTAKRYLGQWKARQLLGGDWGHYEKPEP